MNWFLFLIIFLFYSKTAFNGGVLIVDDWGDIANTLRHASFFDSLRAWFPLFSNRPFAALLITSTTFFFKNHTILYFLFSLALYLSSLLQISNVIKKNIGSQGSGFFFLMSSLPIVSSVLIFSPVNQIVATASIFLWSLSFRLINKHLESGKNSQLIISSLLILSALLIYEIILPFVVLGVIWPYLRNKELNLKYFLSYVLPPSVVFIVIVLWQKVFALFIFGEVYSRLKIPGVLGLYRCFINWGKIFIVELPKLFYDFFSYLFRISFIDYLLVFAVLFWPFFLLSKKNKADSSIEKTIIGFFLIFLSCSALYVFSGSYASVYGYDNRGLTSSWICLAFLLSALFSNSKYIGKALGFALLIVVALSMSIIQNNYIESFATQKNLIKDILSEADRVKLPVDALIVGDVPSLVQNPFRGEMVFTQPWDFGDALYVFSGGKILGGAPINQNIYSQKRFKIDSRKIIFDGWWVAPIEALWIYRFSPIYNRFVLEKAIDDVSLNLAFSNLVNKK